MVIKFKASVVFLAISSVVYADAVTDLIDKREQFGIKATSYFNEIKQ